MCRPKNQNGVGVFHSTLSITRTLMGNENQFELWRDSNLSYLEYYILGDSKRFEIYHLFFIPGIPTLKEMNEW